MVFAGDHEETQVLDANSPRLPGVRSDDETDDGGHDDDDDDDDGVSPDQAIMPMGDTVPTENLREVPDLYGETQALDDPDNGAADGDGVVDGWGKTQLVDSGDEGAETMANDWGKTQLVDGVDEGMDTNDWGKTQLVDSSDEGMETTEVLSGDEGLSDDGATPCGDKRKSGGMEPGIKKRVNGDGSCSDEQGHENGLVDSDASTDEDEQGHENGLVDSDASTDEDDGAGSSRRTFTAVRIASLRSSGLAAACKSDSTISGTESRSSLSNGQSSKEQNGSLGVQVGDMATGRDPWPNSRKDLTSPRTKAGEIDLDHEIENSRGCTQDCNKNGINTAANFFFNEVAPSEADGTTVKSDHIVGKGELPHSLPTDSALAGLSYIGSQEPGDLSQANALEVVDKFLSVNYVESFQEANTGKATDMVKSPPISSTKGAQRLAEKTDHRSPVGKEGIFDWIDSLEDEGGGEFFSRRKDSFFESKSSSRKSQSYPPKARHPISEVPRGAFDKSGTKERANPDGRRITMLAHSDSRLMMHNLTRSKAIRTSETKTKKSLFKDMDEQSNPKSLEQHPEATDVEGGIEGLYDIGPDTQMAAEAIETLVHAPPVDYVMEENQHVLAEHLNENSSKGPSRKTTSSKKDFQKRVPVTDLEGTITRSKRRRMLHTKPRRGENPSFSRENSNRSRMKKSSDDKRRKTKSKREVWNQEPQLNGKSLVNGNASSRSLKREKTQGGMDGTFIKEADKCHNPLTSDGQPSVHKEFTPGEYHVNATPVAHRTRHSKRLNLSKHTEVSSSEYRKDINELTGGIIPGSIERQDMLLLDASEPLNARKGSVDMGPDQTARVRRTSTLHTIMQNIEGLQEDELENSFITKDASNHPKRRRTSQITSGNPNMTSNLNEPSIPDDSLPATNKQSCKQQGRKKVFIRSVSEILDAAKRKRRSVFTHITYKADGRPSATGESSLVSGVRTRSSSFIPYLEKDSKGCLSRPVSHEAGSADAANNCSSGVMSPVEHPKEAALPKQGVYCTPHVEDAEEHAKPEGTPKEKVQQSGLACKSPSKNADAVSPVCVAQDRPRTCNKGSSKSLLRELLRLEATEAASTPALKDLRRRKDMCSVRVLFSHHLDEVIIKQQKKILGRLGVPIASSISDATHFVTNKFVRTRNMLEAIAFGKPVVTHLWLESCGQASCFIDEKNYILRDAKKEKEIGFSMPVSLARACQSPLLQGKRVFITANVKPTRELIASLVKAAHGQPMERIGRSAMKEDKVPEDLLVISCEEDYSICIPLLEKGAGVFSSELLLNGIVIQKLEYERHRLFLDHVKQTRSTIWLRHKDGGRFLPVSKCA